MEEGMTDEFTPLLASDRDAGASNATNSRTVMPSAPPEPRNNGTGGYLSHLLEPSELSAGNSSGRNQPSGSLSARRGASLSNGNLSNNVAEEDDSV